MIVIRRSGDRGHADFGWLDSRHTFSFGQYHDPAQRGFSVLRVINQDRVAPGHGFPMHPHRDFEIFSYILDGALSHEDTTGASATVYRHDVQLISAGTGMAHSEANPSSTDEVHFLQVWLQTNRPGLHPVYSQARFGADAKSGRLCLIMSPDGEAGSLAFRQDARIFATVLRDGEKVEHVLEKRRCVSPGPSTRLRHSCSTCLVSLTPLVRPTAGAGSEHCHPRADRTAGDSGPFPAERMPSSAHPQLRRLT
ncbi:MAG: pirin family protein [Chloroflexi bacterium]|nr:pirin family protein [Chloroflexota bacterium]